MFRNAIFELTNACDRNCRYCFQNGDIQDSVYLDLEKWMQFVNNNRGLFSNIFFSGGEPFLHPSWEQFLQFAVINGYNTR